MKNKQDAETIHVEPMDPPNFQNHRKLFVYQSVIDRLPVPVVLHQEGVICYINEAGCRLVGAVQPEAMTGRLLEEFLQFEERQESECRHATLVRVDGEVRYVQVDAQEFSCHGLPMTKFVLHDVTKQKKAEVGLLAREQRYQTLFENSPNAVFALDRNGNFLSLNAACEQVTGHAASDLLGRPFRVLCADDNPKLWLPLTETLEQGVPQHFETEWVTRAGQRVYMSITCFPSIDHEQIVGMYGIARDITEQKKCAQNMLHLAYHDLLTGLPNRMALHEMLERELQELKQRSEQVAVLLIDLDFFKNINDTMGHSVGDQVLLQVTERLQACVGDAVSLFRIGGDAFVLLLSRAVDEAAVREAAGRVLAQFQEPCVIAEQVFYLTCSIGIAIAPRDGDDVESIMRIADIAMYEAKEKGRNNYQFFTKWLDQKVADRFVLEKELRFALQRNEFFLHYQPQVEIGTREVVGAEALLRWHRPEHGLVSPAQFIPIAEETGLIVPIGDWVLQAACEQAREWQEQGLKPIRISVNLSSRQFQEPTLIEKVKRTLEETGISPEWIGLEITESMIMKDVEHAIQTLEELRQLGIEVSIDDFGTGYSSLVYLKKFPIDKLKIDQTFVRDITCNHDDKAIVRTIITLAKNLGLSVIAEGVETEEQLRALQAEDCDALQGYLFGKPESPELFVGFLLPQSTHN